MISMQQGVATSYQERAAQYLIGDCAECGGGMWIDAPHPDPALAARGATVMQPCPVCNAEDLPNCDICGDLGYVRLDLPREHPGFGKPVPCPANCGAVADQQRERLARLTRYSKLTEEYRDCTFDRFDKMPDLHKVGKTDARRAAGLFVEAAPQRHFIQSNWISGALGSIAPDEMRNWLIFFGRHGLGKTGLAASIVNALAEEGRPCLYIRWQDALQAIQRRYREDFEQLGDRDDFGMLSSSAVLDEIKNAPVLILDELFVSDERALETRDRREKLEAIMRHRAAERLPTVITTNYNLDVLETAWGTVTLSVVRQRSFAIPVTGLQLRPGEVVAPAEGV